jgi:hypothetical protein
MLLELSDFLGYDTPDLPLNTLISKDDALKLARQ